MAAVTDPLALLPSEIILQVLDFAPSSTLASLTRTSKAWHQFIEVDHQNAIYSSPAKTEYPHGAKNFDFLSSKTSFSKYFDSISTWKELCKRQTILARNWAAVEPETRESIVQVGRQRVWRFKPDFKRRFFLSTSHDGGVQVTSMDTGRVIWGLPRSDVRPHAHLEYQDGTAVWDRYGNALEVWKTDFPDGVPGEFRRVAVINHEVETRGFQFAFDTLCVASSEGEGFVYDMSHTPPVLRTHISLRDGAMGHVYQDADAVLFSMAQGGFDFYEKEGGEFLGTLDGIGCTKYRHINHPAVRSPSLFDANRFEPIRPAYPPSQPRRDRLTPLNLEFGPLSGVHQVSLEADDWGAGMIDGGVFVGLSRGGRILVCPRWRQALKEKRLREDYARLQEEEDQRLEEQAQKGEESTVDNASFSAPLDAAVGNTQTSGEEKPSLSHLPPPPPPDWTVIECQDNGTGFDLGGWLAIKDNRFLCEMSGRIYIIALAEDGDVYQGKPKRASWCLSTASSSELKSPVSFMGLYDDCIMSTYAVLGWDSTVDDGENLQPVRRIFPTKAIRTISFSPETEGTPALWQSRTAASQQARHLAEFMNLIPPMLRDEADGFDEDVSEPSDTSDAAVSNDDEDEDEYEGMLSERGEEDELDEGEYGS